MHFAARSRKLGRRAGDSGTKIRCVGDRHRQTDRGSDIRNPRNPSRSAVLDGVRGLAALTVFGFHVWLYEAKGTGPEVWQDMVNELRIGLVCFFVLSGYLLYGAFARAARRQAGEASIGRYA